MPRKPLWLGGDLSSLRPLAIFAEVPRLPIAQLTVNLWESLVGGRKIVNQALGLASRYAAFTVSKTLGVMP